LRQHDYLWPTWVEVVLGPFAETKGPRLPDGNPAPLSTKKKLPHIEENGNITWKNDFVPVGLNLMNIVWQNAHGHEQPKGTWAA